MDNQKMIERFEEAFLAGRSRDDVMVSSCLHRGAGGEYFNPNTRMAFAWFLNGADSVVVELPKPDDTYCEECNDCWQRGVQDTAKAIEAAGGAVKS